jgi:uncharacterized protein
MRWRRGTRSGRVVDARSAGGPGGSLALRRGGPLGIIIAVVVAVLFGGGVLGGEGGGAFGGVDSPFEAFPEEPGGFGSTDSVPGAPDPERELVEFVSFVFDDVQGAWARDFAEAGRRYDPATLVIFRRGVGSGCGTASSAVGPFYCPVDRRVYLDLGFFRELATRFQAPGDFAQAYVIAHEVGHHVQTLTGVSDQVRAAARDDPSIANEVSIRQELMADCLAGVWGHSTYERGILESGDLEEGLSAAAAVGDDRIQGRATGQINPESWTHGSSEQRTRWFLNGFNSGDAGACDTFAEGG